MADIVLIAIDTTTGLPREPLGTDRIALPSGVDLGSTSGNWTLSRAGSDKITFVSGNTAGDAWPVGVQTAESVISDAGFVAEGATYGFLTSPNGASRLMILDGSIDCPGGADYILKHAGVDVLGIEAGGFRGFDSGRVENGFVVNDGGGADGDLLVKAVGGGTLFMVDVSTGLTTAGAISVAALTASGTSTLADVTATDIDCSGEVEGNQFAVNSNVVVTSGRVLQNITQAVIDNITLDGNTISTTSGGLIVGRSDSTTANLTIGESGDTVNQLVFGNSGGGALPGRIQWISTLLDLDPATASTTSGLFLRFGRATNTSGSFQSLFYLGNNSATVSATLDHKAGTFATSSGMSVGSSTFGVGPKWVSGTGSPEGVVTAVVGSLYSRTDGGAGTSLYVKESGTGNTGWAAK